MTFYVASFKLSTKRKFQFILAAVYGTLVLAWLYC